MDKISSIKEKYLKNGFDALSEYEKIALLLSYSDGVTAVESAEKLLRSYSSLLDATNSDPEHIMKECAISEQSAVLLSLISQLRRKHGMESVADLRLNTAENAKRYFSAYMKEQRFEIFSAAAVNNRFRVLECRRLMSGTFSNVGVSIRATVDFALKNNAYGIVISHCHPDCTSDPSAADISATVSISTALLAAGVLLIDHIITGIDGALSLRQSNDSAIFPPVNSYKAIQ